MDKPPNFKKEMCRVCFSSNSSLESLYSMINFDTLTQLKSFIQIDEVEGFFFIYFFLSQLIFLFVYRKKLQNQNYHKEFVKHVFQH